MSQTIVLGSPVQCSDTKEQIALLLPRVSGVVLNPNATHLDYLVVHSGLLRGHDQCVPIGNIQNASPNGIRLTINTEHFKALPELEAKVTGASYTQRIVSTDSLVINKIIPIIDEAREVLGRFAGVVIDSTGQVEQILMDQQAQKPIPLDRLITCTEENVLIRREQSSVDKV